MRRKRFTRCAVKCAMAAGANYARVSKPQAASTFSVFVGSVLICAGLSYSFASSVVTDFLCQGQQAEVRNERGEVC